MKRKPPIKIMDVLIIFAALCLTGFSVFSAYIKPGDAERVVVEGEDQSWVFPLDAEETINVRGPLGITVVRIHGKEAWVESSPCDNQTCVAMGHTGYSGGWAACLPNNVFFLIEGKDERTNFPDRIAW